MGFVKLIALLEVSHADDHMAEAETLERAGLQAYELSLAARFPRQCSRRKHCGRNFGQLLNAVDGLHQKTVGVGKPHAFTSTGLIPALYV